MVSIDKFLIVDLVNKGSSHELFNSEIVNFLSSYSDVVYIGYNTHLFSQTPKNQKFEFQSIELKSYRSSFIRVLYFLDILIKLTYTKKNQTVYILALNVREIQFLIFLSYFKSSKKEINLFLHSNLEYIVKNKKTTSGLLLRSNLRKYVLGEWIFHKLSSVNNINNIFNVFHPISEVHNGNNRFKKISFVFTGVCTSNKGFDFFCRIWKNFFDEPNLEFLVSGSIDMDYYNFLCSEFGFLKDFPISQHFISKSDYDKNCLTATHIILPQREQYSYISSGSFLDCFIYLKPVITLENDMSLYYFEKYGDIGYLCKSEDEMLQTIRKIISVNDLGEYFVKVKNLKIAREKYKNDYKNSLKTLI